MAKKRVQKSPTQLDETGRRETTSDRRQATTPVSNDRRKVQRRRQIDPTTCERDYNDAEIEFMQALDEYKRQNGRMFPTCSEILEVIQKLGYRKGDSIPFDSTCQNTTDDTSDTDEMDEIESLLS